MGSLCGGPAPPIVTSCGDSWGRAAETAAHIAGELEAEFAGMDERWVAWPLRKTRRLDSPGGRLWGGASPAVPVWQAHAFS